VRSVEYEMRGIKIFPPQRGLDYWHVDERTMKEAWDGDGWVAEPKYDGLRFVLYFHHEGNLVLSSRFNKGGFYTDRAPQLPHLRDLHPGFPDGTCFDGELMMEEGPEPDSWSRASALVHAGPEKALAKQERYGFAKLYVFDMMATGNVDMRSMKFSERRMVLEEAVKLLDSEYVVLVEQREDRREYYKEALARGYEGVMLKDLNSTYNVRGGSSRTKGWIKVKPKLTIDGFITGYKTTKAAENNPRYKNTIGAIMLSAYDKDGKVREFGGCVPGSLELRKKMANPDGTLRKEYYGRVVEVTGQELNRASNRLRFCQFVRFRDDKRPEECRI